jgi:hypothetical protein
MNDDGSHSDLQAPTVRFVGVSDRTETRLFEKVPDPHAFLWVPSVSIEVCADGSVTLYGGGVKE